MEPRDREVGDRFRLIRHVQMAADEDEACLLVVIGLQELGYPAMLSFLQTIDGARVIVADPKLAAEGRWARIAEKTLRSYDDQKDLLPRVLRRRESRFIIDSRIDALGENDGELCRRIGLISQYVVPLFTPSLEIGTLQLDLGEREAEPAVDERIWLDAIGAVTSLAIERSRLTRQVEVLEEQIVQERDLVAFASTSAGTVHGLRHELKRYILGLHLTMQLEEVRANKEALKFLRRTDSSVVDWIDRLDDCIIAGSGDFRPKVAPIKPIVDSTVKRLWEQWQGRGYAIQVLDECVQAKARVRERALSEILATMIVNSIQAKARGITVLIRRPLATSLNSKGAPPAGIVEIVVRDDGQGVPEAFRSQIGKFGWTSKAKDGTGIGLTVAYLLAKEMGAEIVLHSGGKSAGQSFTEFAVRIPTVEP